MNSQHDVVLLTLGAHARGLQYLFCHGEYGPTLNWSGGTIYGCHKRSPPAITGPGRTIRGNIYIPARSCLILRSRNVLAIYELPSSNKDQMEFR